MIDTSVKDAVVSVSSGVADTAYRQLTDSAYNEVSSNLWAARRAVDMVHVSVYSAVFDEVHDS